MPAELINHTGDQHLERRDIRQERGAGEEAEEEHGEEPAAGYRGGDSAGPASTASG